MCLETNMCLQFQLLIQQNLWKSVNLLWRYCDFFVFQDGGRRQLYFENRKILLADEVQRANT